MIDIRTMMMGDLTIRIAGEPRGARKAVVLCHGYGAPGTDLVPLARELCQLAPELAGATAFVFPEAPESLEGLGLWGGRAWWPISLEALESYARGAQRPDNRGEEPEGLAHARRLLLKMLEEFSAASGLAYDRMVLGGFSQGAMLTTDVALALDEPPAGLVILSGTLLSESSWRKRAARRAGLPVFQSHGRQDPLLPYALAEALRDLLTGAGLSVDFHAFDGEHTIAAEVLEALPPWLMDGPRAPRAPSSGDRPA